METMARLKHRRDPVWNEIQRPILVWREGLSLDVPAIDKDHRQLIDLLNRLHLMAPTANSREAIGAAFVDLENHVHHHFRKEEMLMRLCGYPAYQEHCRMHRALAARVADFRAKFRKDPARFSVNGLHDFLGHWVAVHIGREDIKIEPYIALLAREQAA